MKRSRAGYITAVLMALLVKVGLDGAVGKSQLAIMGKHSFVSSNLPGYDRPVQVCDAKISRIGVFFPNMLTKEASMSRQTYR